jgi:AcrR family transcriptional regulator
MGISDRKEREKQELRELILRTATRMFAEEGYEGTSLRSIADRIEYSAATIYRYFHDKDDLLFAVQEVAFGILLSRFEQTRSIANPLERLRAVGRSYIDFALENPDYYQLMFILTGPMKLVEEHRKWELGASSFGYLVATVQECIAKGHIAARHDPMLLAMSLWAQAHGLVSLKNCNRLIILQLPEPQLRELLYASMGMVLDIVQEG